MLLRCCLLLLLLAAPGAWAQTTPAAGATFQDCSTCPQMTVVPAGRFVMGEEGTWRSMPRHPVGFVRPFAIGTYLVTFDEWDACVADGGCGLLRLADQGWGRGRRPVINVNWNQAAAFAQWLARRTGRPYRLPSEAEWEYAARGGTSTTFWWGDDPALGLANCAGCGSPYDDRQTAPVGSFRPNPFGLYDMAGNLTQWVADPWHADYQGAPADGSVWEPGDPLRRTLRGGSWYNRQSYSRSAYRNGDSPQVANPKIGFRIALPL